MDQKLNIGQKAEASLVRSRGIEDFFNPAGKYQVEHWRGGELIATYDVPNGVTNEGKNDALNVIFGATAKISLWYGLMINLTGYTALAAGDIYDNINQVGNGWDEFTAYTDANNTDSTTTRPVWDTDAAASQAISNGATKMIYDITGNGTVKGLGIVGRGTNASVKGDHASDGILWATALFTQGDVVVTTGDQLKVTYTVNC